MQKIKLTVSQLNIGDMLPDTIEDKYGYFTNRIISDIYITKAGRYRVKIKDTYMCNGVEGLTRESNLYHGAVVGTHEITVLK